MTTSSSGPDTAAIAARCATLQTLDVAWLWKLVDALDDVGRADHPTDAPPCHGVGLRHTVDDDALFGQVRHHHGHRREFVAAIGEVFIDLVGDHPDTVGHCPFANRLDRLRRVDRTGRVVRADEQQHLGLVGLRCIELFDGDLEAGLSIGVDHDGHTTGERDGLGVGGPVRRRADDLVTRITECRESGVDGVLSTVRDQHVCRLTLKTRVAQRLVADGLLQFGEAAGRAVLVVLRIGARRGCRIDDVLRRCEVGLAGTETDDVFTSGLHGLGLGVDGERGRRSNGSETSRCPRHGVHGLAYYDLAPSPTPIVCVPRTRRRRRVLGTQTSRWRVSRRVGRVG